MRSARLLAALGVLILIPLAPGCDDVTVPPNPSAFDRPESVVFFCWDLNNSEAVALDSCEPIGVADGEEDTAEPRDGFALHALVTQTSTGEVAAVRLSGTGSEPGVIDSDVRIPGFTFAAVGEVPSALAISTVDPKHVFVASRGSNDLRVISVADFRKGLGTPVTTYDTLLEDGTRPSDMVIAPDGSALFVALPTRGQIARIPVLDDGLLGDVELLDLSTTIPDPVDLSGLSDDQLPADYRFICNTPPLMTPAPIAPREPVTLGPSPEPWSLLLDEESGTLLVSDRTMPLIHVIDVETFTEQEPFSVSVPTRELALTPRVPATFGDVDPSERFLYAIDETDRSVFVVDITDPARGSYGGVLTVNVLEPLDRLRTYGISAQALTVLSPRYSDEEPTTECRDADGGMLANGLDLNGVFLAVGTIDGRVRFFDIFDRDASCRGDASCTSAANPNTEDGSVTIARHRPRFGAVRDDPGVLVDAPTWDTDGAGTALVAANGTADSDRVPALQPITCTEPQADVFPATANEDDGVLVCAVRDPWAALGESFTIAYEGAIPSAGSGGADFEGSDLELGTPGLCSRGVLGALDVPADGPLAGYAGDMVALVSDLPPTILQGDEARLERCEVLADRTPDGSTTPIRIAVERAFDDGRLVLGEVLEPVGASLAEVGECFPEFVEVEIRPRGAFVVGSSIVGFSHPIATAAADAENPGACVVDAAVAEVQRGRAFFGGTYETPRIAFSLGPPPANLSRPVLELSISQVPNPLTIDVSAIGSSTSGASLLAGLTYNEVDQRLYIIDQASQGLVRIRLTPALTVQQTFR